MKGQSTIVASRARKRTPEPSLTGRFGTLFLVPKLGKGAERETAERCQERFADERPVQLLENLRLGIPRKNAGRLKNSP